nr:class I SAM-dependent methyltransferase [uncultured Campylobacter sp.]
MISKPVLDVCCGGRMFYKNKQDERVLFCDKREIKTTLCDGRKFIVEPDMLVDFKDLPFDDESFSLVIFDPPHLLKLNDKSFIAIKYGKLPMEYKLELSAGFRECWRVLKVGGTLIFKWSEVQISLKDILNLFTEEPLITQNTANKSHFCVFFKSKFSVNFDLFS